MPKPVAGFLLSEALAIACGAIGFVAIPWLLVDSGASALHIAEVFAMQSVGTVIAALVGSPFVDRIDARKFCIGSRTILAINLSVMIALYILGKLSVQFLALLVAFSAVLLSLSEAACSSLVPFLSRQTGVPSSRINGLVGTFHNFGDLIGPATGGFVIAIMGIAAALALDGIAFALSSVILLVAVPAWPRGRDCGATERPDQRLLAGAREVWQNPMLLCITVVSAVTNIAITVLLFLVVPVLVKLRGGNALDLGLTLSAFGLGGLIASAWYTWRGRSIQSLPSMLRSLLMTASATVSISYIGAKFLPILLLSIGIAVGYLGPLEQTLVQNAAGETRIGRVLLAYSAGRTVLLPLGYLVTGGVADIAGISSSPLLLGLVLLGPISLLAYHARYRKALWTQAELNYGRGV